MAAKFYITDIHATEILDSRGNPTVGVTVTAKTEGGREVSASASVPSGASTGRFEAVELRDGEKRYFGLGTRKVAEHVNTKIKEKLVGTNILKQAEIDRMMTDEDGTENKGNLGANAILGVSMACAKTAARALGIPLYRYLGGADARELPVPMMNVVNGGVHAKNPLDFQEFMILPVGAENFADGLRMGAEVYHFLKKILSEAGFATAVGDEGGFAPDFTRARDVFCYLQKAVEAAGYRVGEDVVFAMDAAASELYDETRGVYLFPGEAEGEAPGEIGMHERIHERIHECMHEGKARSGGESCRVTRSAEEMIALYEELAAEFPIVSVEDGLFEDDWEGWQKLTARLGGKMQLVGDDLFVTNPKRLSCGIGLGAANAVLVKVNQIGTVTEALETIGLAKRAGYRTVISHRSGETEDTFIADLAVAVNAGQIKCGAPCRGERTAKYNRLLRIAEELGAQGVYGGKKSFSPFLKK